MRTIIHDLDEKAVKKMNFDKEDKIISALSCGKNCIGCFSCWVKHPKMCALKDEFSDIVEFIKDSDELVLISKSRYGCYSGSVKRVLERCIGYVLPFFTIRNNEIHHESRYGKKIKFSAYFYGDIFEREKESLNTIVKANVVNLNANDYSVICVNNLKELEKCIH